MAQYELSMTPKYVINWELKHALREIVQNAKDQETVVPNNNMEIKYNKEEQILTISNKSSVLESNSLLLGESTKQDDDNTIGKFGEGYKLALLVLARDKYPVKIYNYGNKEVWTSRIRKSRKWKSDILLVEVEKYIFKKVPNANLTFEIGGIAEEDYEEFVKDTLYLKEDINRLETKMGGILDNEDEKGRVYVNGLFVTELDSLEYGYDILPKHIEIGRDRNLVNSYDIHRITSQMVLEAFGEEDSKLIRMYESTYKDLSYISDSWRYTGLVYSETDSLSKSYDDVTNLNKQFIELYYKSIVEKNKDKVVIFNKTYGETLYNFPKDRVEVVTVDSDIYDKLKELPEYIEVYNKELDRLLNAETVDVDGMYRKWRKSVEYSLTEEQKTVIDNIVRLYKGEEVSLEDIQEKGEKNEDEELPF